MTILTIDWSTTNIDGSNTVLDAAASVDFDVATPVNGRESWSLGNIAGKEVLVGNFADEPVTLDVSFGAPVANVSFELLHVDADTWDDQITVIALDADGSAVPVRFINPAFHHSVSGGTLSTNGNVSGWVVGSGPTDSVRVNVAGPIVSLRIIFDNCPDAATAGIVGVSDVTFSTVAAGGYAQGSSAGGTIDIAHDGGPMLPGKNGNDGIVLAGRGDDTVRGGTGADTLFVNGGWDTFVGGTDIDVLDLTGSGVDFITYDDNDAEAGVVTFTDGSTMTFTEIENVIPCFTPGTLIATPRGERPAESLKAGDRVLTRDNGIQYITWAGKKELNLDDLKLTPNLLPIMIRKGALGNDLPERDMMVSPNHRVLVVSEMAKLYFGESEVLMTAKHMTKMDGVEVMKAPQATYIHFMCQNHEVVLSNGAWTESFQPSDYSLKGVDADQREELFLLFPELATREGLKNYRAARRSVKKSEARLFFRK